MFRARLGDDLELRLLERRHAELLFALVNENREHLRPWMSWLESTRSSQDIEAFIRSGLEQLARGDGFQAGIWLDGELVGVVGYHYWRWHSRRTEIGYWLGEAAQGRGVMTRACRSLCDHAFGELGLKRIEIHCDAENIRSRKVAERLGFTQEGILRGVGFNAAGPANEVIYGMLAHEWKPEENAT